MCRVGRDAAFFAVTGMIGYSDPLTELPEGAIVLISVFWLGLVSASKSLFSLQHVLIMPAMIIPMLFRLDLYTGRVGHTVEKPETALSKVVVGH